MINFLFLFNAVLLGVGLAMDAFSVSLANGLHEPRMKMSRTVSIASVFGIFQTAMPLLGWFFVHSLLEMFQAFQKFIPWIAFALLLYIGGKMVIEGIGKKEEEETPSLGFGSLMVQGVATSIDALSVGFTIAEYDFFIALIETLIIGIVTFAICVAGLEIGKKFGTKFSNRASILGGAILIGIGLEILITSFL